MVDSIGGLLGAKGGLPGLGDKTVGAAQPGKEFSEFVKDAARSAVDTVRTGEQQSIKGIKGEADLNDVVAAVASAEITLQTVMTLRDRVVSAYQQIMRMPI